MHRQTVVPLDRQKYTKVSPAVLEYIFSTLRSSFDGKYWVCEPCDAARSRGRVPVQAKCNGLKLSTMPPELILLN